MVQNSGVDETIAQDQISLAEALDPPQGDQTWVSRAGTHQVYSARLGITTLQILHGKRPDGPKHLAPGFFGATYRKAPENQAIGKALCCKINLIEWNG